MAQRFDPTARAPVRYRFRYEKVLVGKRRDLRQVGDTQHLMVLRDIPQLVSDHLGDGASHSGVDLVEHVEPRRPEAGQYSFDREKRARQLPATRDQP